MKRFMSLAFSKSNLNRAVVMAVIVGTLLGVINHYDMFVSGEYPRERVLKVLITYLVPFFVSLISSVLADMKRTDRA